MRKQNDGQITKVWTVIGGETINLPAKLQISYRNAKDFVAALAVIWRNYEPLRNVTMITPELLAYHLDNYNIKTQKGDYFVPGTLGPYNLLRAAYRDFYILEEQAREAAKMALNKSSKLNLQTDALHWKNLKENIVNYYVNVKGRPYDETMWKVA